MSKFTKHKVTIIQGVVGDFTIDQLGWLSKEEQEKFWIKHSENVDRLKAEGQYLQPLEIEVELEYSELFDAPVKLTPTTESYRMDILDFNK